MRHMQAQAHHQDPHDLPTRDKETTQRCFKIERNVLAVVEACRHEYAQLVLLRNDVNAVVHCDNKPLVSAMEKRSPVRDPSTLKPVRQTLQANIQGLRLRWAWLSGHSNVVADQGARQFEAQRRRVAGAIPRVQFSTDAPEFVPAASAGPQQGEPNDAPAPRLLAPLSTAEGNQEHTVGDAESTSSAASEPSKADDATTDDSSVIWSSAQTSADERGGEAARTDETAASSAASAGESTHSGVTSNSNPPPPVDGAQRLGFAADESHEDAAGSRSESAADAAAERRDARDERAVASEQRRREREARQTREAVEFAQSAMRELFDTGAPSEGASADETRRTPGGNDSERTTARSVLNEDMTRWAEQQRHDPTLRKYVAAAEDSGLSAQGAIARRRPALDGTGRVFVFIEGRGQPVLLVPRPRRLEIMLAHHAHAGDLVASDETACGPHGGVAATQALVRQHFYWPGVDADIKAHVEECHYCQQFKGHVGARSRVGQIGQYDEQVGRFEVVHADLAEMPVSRNGNKYFVLFIDRATGAVETRALPSKKGKGVKAAFREAWVYRYGAPRLLIPDGAGELAGGAMQAFSASIGTKLEPVAPRNPAGNGLAERAVDLIKRKLTVLLHSSKTDRWDEMLRRATFSYMCAFSGPRRATPFQLVYGTRVHTTLERKLGLHHDERHSAATGAELLGIVKYKIDALADAAREGRVAQAQAVSRSRAKQSGGKPHTFSPDDIVWLENDGSLHNTKFENRQKRSGPYQIVRQDPSGKTRFQLKDYYTQRVVKNGGFGKHRSGARYFPARLLTPARGIISAAGERGVATAEQEGPPGAGAGDEEGAPSDGDAGSDAVGSDATGADDEIDVVRVLGRPRADATRGYMIPVQLASGEAVELPGAQFPDLLSIARGMGRKRRGGEAKTPGGGHKAKAGRSSDEHSSTAGVPSKKGSKASGFRSRHPRVSTIQVSWRRRSPSAAPTPTS